MPANVPERDLTCYFLGAGFSSAFGLPNTTVLLTKVHELADKYGLAIGDDLKAAYKFFYPEESASFVPEVVDFFSVVRAYEDVAKGFPGGFGYPSLLTDLKLSIARLICTEVRDLEIPAAGWPQLDEGDRPVQRLWHCGVLRLPELLVVVVEVFSISCRSGPRRVPTFPLAHERTFRADRTKVNLTFAALARCPRTAVTMNIFIARCLTGQHRFL
jgi:hypothetical protein